jgi:excisionase family DNA binding protein
MADIEPNEDLLTVDEVAAQLRVNPQTVRNWIDAGKLPAVRVGDRRVRIHRPALDEFVGLRTSATPVRSKAQKARANQSLPFDAQAAAVALDQIAAGFTALASVLRDTQSRGN